MYCIIELFEMHFDRNYSFFPRKHNKNLRNNRTILIENLFQIIP